MPPQGDGWLLSQTHEDPDDPFVYRVWMHPVLGVAVTVGVTTIDDDPEQNAELAAECNRRALLVIDELRQMFAATN